MLLNFDSPGLQEKLKILHENMANIQEISEEEYQRRVASGEAPRCIETREIDPETGQARTIVIPEMKQALLYNNNDPYSEPTLIDCKPNTFGNIQLTDEMADHYTKPGEVLDLTQPGSTQMINMMREAQLKTQQQVLNRQKQIEEYQREIEGGFNNMMEFQQPYSEPNPYNQMYYNQQPQMNYNIGFQSMNNYSSQVNPYNQMYNNMGYYQQNPYYGQQMYYNQQPQMNYNMGYNQQYSYSNFEEARGVVDYEDQYMNNMQMIREIEIESYNMMMRNRAISQYAEKLYNPYEYYQPADMMRYETRVNEYGQEEVVLIMQPPTKEELDNELQQELQKYPVKNPNMFNLSDSMKKQIAYQAIGKDPYSMMQQGYGYTCDNPFGKLIMENVQSSGQLINPFQSGYLVNQYGMSNPYMNQQMFNQSRQQNMNNAKSTSEFLKKMARVAAKGCGQEITEEELRSYDVKQIQPNNTTLTPDEQARFNEVYNSLTFRGLIPSFLNQRSSMFINKLNNEYDQIQRVMEGCNTLEEAFDKAGEVFDIQTRELRIIEERRRLCQTYNHANYAGELYRYGFENANNQVMGRSSSLIDDLKQMQNRLLSNKPTLKYGRIENGRITCTKDDMEAYIKTHASPEEQKRIAARDSFFNAMFNDKSGGSISRINPELVANNPPPPMSKSEIDIMTDAYTNSSIGKIDQNLSIKDRFMSMMQRPYEPVNIKSNHSEQDYNNNKDEEVDIIELQKKNGVKPGQPRFILIDREEGESLTEFMYSQSYKNINSNSNNAIITTIDTKDTFIEDQLSIKPKIILKYGDEIISKNYNVDYGCDIKSNFDIPFIQSFPQRFIITPCSAIPMNCINMARDNSKGGN